MFLYFKNDGSWILQSLNPPKSRLAGKIEQSISILNSFKISKTHLFDSVKEKAGERYVVTGFPVMSSKVLVDLSTSFLKTSIL